MTEQTTTPGIESLEPAPVWRFFAGIAAIPRPSKREERIRAHVREIAEKHGLQVREDRVGNMLLEVLASPGCEIAPVTVLQGHLDMVPEKNARIEHNFERDPIRLLIEEDPQTNQLFVRADGTTLGADNGIGVAMALAAATEPDVKHGPLELLCTVDEEAGMTGAKALSPDFFKGKRLINLDSEEDNAIYIGCAGGCETTLTWNFKLQPVGGTEQVARVTVNGLRGGHSGGDIHENRGNANKILTRTLLRAADGLRIAAITGGSKRNVIPREANALVCGPKEVLAALGTAGPQVRAEVLAESDEANLQIKIESVAADQAPTALAAEDTHRLLLALAALPHGVLGMHPKMPGLVQTSNNTAIVSSEKAGETLKVQVCTLARSSSASLLHVTRDQIEAIGRLAGAAVQSGNEYPGWEPNPDSRTLAICRRVYKELFGEEPHVAAIHAGLECGVINERMRGTLDAVSFGPTITGAHSPDEKVYVDSVAKSWRYLRAVLAELTRG
ncbi:MAG: aminoacyl-histidine dipeptidase [Phycisphaerae bacterium]